MLGAALGAATAHAQGAAGALRPCRASFDEATTGGDVLTQRGEIRFDRSLPQADGSLIMFGTGTSTVTYTAVGACRVVSGSPFTAKMTATLVSDDGVFAEIDITPVDAEFPITFQCGRGTAETSAGVDGLPTVRLPLRHGASARYSEGGRRGSGIYGTVTLELCGADGQPPEPTADEAAVPPAAGVEKLGDAEEAPGAGAFACIPDARRKNPFDCTEQPRRRRR
jgi:hypothetical protein